MDTVSPLADADPRTVGPYTLTGRLSDGRAGAVFLASAPDGRPVVVDVVHADLAGEPQFRARLLRDAQAAQRVPSAFTAAVLDVNAEALRPYLVTEYVKGPTLAEAVRRNGPMPVADLRSLAVAAANALAAIHAASMIHRDLNTDNIVLSATGARLVDFGITQPMEDTRLVTHPEFKAPEQLLGAAATPAADVFAWGGVVLFAATGRLPHGIEGPPHEVIRRALYEPPDLTGLDPALARLVASALGKDPTRRPTAQELVAALAAGPATTPESIASDAIIALPMTATGSDHGGGHSGIGGPGGPGGEWGPGSQPAAQPARPKPRTASTWWLRAWIAVPIVLLAVALSTIGYVVAVGGGPTGDDDVTTTTAGPAPTAPPAPSASPTRSRAPFIQPTPLGDPLGGHTQSVTWVEFSPDGDTLATTGYDGAVILWDVTDPASARRLGQPLVGHAGAVWTLAFSPDGATLATGGDDGTVILWDVTDPTAPRQVGQPLTGHTEGVTWVEFSPDGITLATASNDRTVTLWNVADPAAARPLGQPLTGHTDSVYAATFSPDGATLATASADATVILWDVTDPTAPAPLGEPLTEHTGAVWTAAFSPDGTTLATTSDDQTAILWDVTDPTAPVPLGEPLTEHTGAVWTAAFSPDGTTLATGSEDQTAILWDVTDPTATPKPLGEPLTDHAGGVYWLAFSPDGRTLATASDDTTVRLWDLDG